MRVRGGWIAAVVVVALIGGCSGSDDPSSAPATSGPTLRPSTTVAAGPSPTGGPSTTGADEAEVWPGDEWERIDPAGAGLDAAALDEIAADAERRGSRCFLVVRHGRVAGEWYWAGTDAASSQDVFSVTKSVAGTLVGLAVADGDLALDQPAATHIPAWAGTPAEAVTVGDLLGGASGREWSLLTDYVGLLTASDRDAYAAGLGQDAAPGTRWVYGNAAVQDLDAVLRSATGEDVAAFADARLFAPIGMARSDLSKDAAGGTTLFTGLQSTCEDLARFGLLFLRGGRWRDAQVLPADWVTAATGRPSQDLNAAYGRLWWLNREGPVLTDVLRETSAEDAAAMTPRRLVAEAPADTYWAIGLGGQILQVDPGSDTVVVRLGPAALTTGSGPGGTGPYGPDDTTRVLTDAVLD